jgi:hypothetical protein
VVRGAVPLQTKRRDGQGLRRACVHAAGQCRFECLAALYMIDDCFCAYAHLRVCIYCSLLGLRRKVTTLCYPSAMPGMLIRRAPSTHILHSTPAVQWAGM